MLDELFVQLGSVTLGAGQPLLLAMDDQDVIDVLRVTEEQAAEAGEVSLVAYWLSLMPSDRAAVLQRKMSRTTGG